MRPAGPPLASPPANTLRKRQEIELRPRRNATTYAREPSHVIISVQVKLMMDMRPKLRYTARQSLFFSPSILRRLRMGEGTDLELLLLPEPRHLGVVAAGLLQIPPHLDVAAAGDGLGRHVLHGVGFSRIAHISLFFFVVLKVRFQAGEWGSRLESGSRQTNRDGDKAKESGKGGLEVLSEKKEIRPYVD